MSRFNSSVLKSLLNARFAHLFPADGPMLCISPGWYPLLWQTLEKIDCVVRECLGASYELYDMKEKYNSLRFYSNASATICESITAIEGAAENASEEQQQVENWLQDPRLTIDEEQRNRLVALEQKRLQADRTFEQSLKQKRRACDSIKYGQPHKACHYSYQSALLSCRVLLVMYGHEIDDTQALDEIDQGLWLGLARSRSLADTQRKVTAADAERALEFAAQCIERIGKHDDDCWSSCK